jgi:hypothetical protein
MLPKELREQLDKTLIEKAFAGYQSLSDWLAERGFKISRSSLQRYGSQFDRRLEAVTIATQQARALAEAEPDREGAMTDALARLVQEKMFAVLVEAEEMDNTQLTRLARAIANLGRATVTQKKWAESMRERLDVQKRTAVEAVGEMVHAGGLTPEAAARIRSVLLGIDPLPTGDVESGHHVA